MYVSGAAVLLTALLVTWLAWPSGPGAPGAGRVRQYLDVRACLLTGSAGVSHGQAAQAWASMESASAASRAMVSYLPVAAAGPPAGSAAAGPYLASLAERRCGVIVTVGRPQNDAATAAAARFPRIQFIVIAAPGSGQRQRGRPNLTQLTSASAAAIRTTISQAITAAAGHAPAT